MRLGPLALLAAVPAVLVAQSPIYPTSLGGVGPEFRRVAFGQGIGLTRASQLVFRSFGGVPLTRRLFLDVATNFALTALEGTAGDRLDLSGLTDTQVRATYTLGRDQAVFSVLLNVPTGEEKVPSGQLPLLRAIAQNFLPFPASSYGAGAGVTGGAALAQQLGSWSLGLAASVRYLSRYSPFSDLDDAYQPGVETRVRLGVRRPFGRYTLAAGGFTFSTFGADEFSGVQNFTYRPGNRYIAELLLARQVNRTTLRVFGWGFFRAAGDSSGATVVRARERILYAGANWTVPLGRRVSLDPGFDGRVWRAADGAQGGLLGVDLTARASLTRALTLAPACRLERGTLRDADGFKAPFVGLSFSVFLRAGLR